MDRGQVKLDFVSILIDSSINIINIKLTSILESLKKPIFVISKKHATKIRRFDAFRRSPQITDPFVHLTNRTVQRRSGAQMIGKRSERGLDSFGTLLLSYADTKHPADRIEVSPQSV